MSSFGDSTLKKSNIYSNITKKISDIFLPFTASDGLIINPCIILIEGAPGIGKTVLAKEIAFQWANNKLLNDKKIVLLIILRECNFNNIKSVENLVEHVVGSSKMTASLTEYFVQTEGKDLAIVFDGYDEISEEDRKNSIVARIIYRRIFGKSCLVITSRPTASSNLHGTVDCRVEIVGFTEENRLDYIKTALQGNDDKVEALTLYLQSNPTINALCYIPLNMTILLCLAEDGIEKLPKTQTDMYKKFIEMTIIRFIQKSNIKSTTIIKDIANLPDPHNKVFKELAQLAYKSLKIDKIVFTLNEIETVCPNMSTTSSNWNGLGLLKAVQYFEVGNNRVTFHFLHFSIQEYMAAWYISTLPNGKQIKLLKKTFWLQRYYNTWIMYVGITCGSSFALKHFLSGNWFQISTRIFKPSGISKKFVENKIKCLHLFQCLVESNNEDMIASVSKFFQDNQIDLSNQTLLPSDVNTLGFFLIRSINKHWEMLNLSGCNIGSIGINILCDGFLSKESRDIVVIKEVNFSYNQLKFSSVLQIFDLLKSWHTSQLFIKDNEILQDHPSSDVYKAIEDAFFTCNYNKPVGLEIGSFLFGLEIDMFSMVLLSVVSIRSIYLINCSNVSNLLQAEQNLSKVHLINTPLPLKLMTTLCSCLLKTGNTDLFVYNPELPDQDADELCDLILSSEMTDGIMMIISNSKMQGIINTFTISEQLTRLEVLNLAINVYQKRSNYMQTSPWKGNLCYGSNDKNLISDIFIELLHKITCNKWNWQLRIILIEKNVLIAHGVNYECISEKTRINQPLNTVYLSDCSITSREYLLLFDTKRTWSSLYIFNSFIDQNWLTNVITSSLICKELFMHSLGGSNIEEIISCYFKENCSTVLVANNEMFACNPTTKQIALALQLEPSIDILYLAHCPRSFDCFNQIITMLTSTQHNWTKLDFMNCRLGEIEYEVLQKHLSQRINKLNSTVKILQVSSKQLTKLLVPKFIKTVLMWKVQQLIFYDISHTVYECFVTRFTTIPSGEAFLSVTYNSKKDIYFCNHSWNQITKLLKGSSCATLYIIDCYFPLQAENLNITEFSHISKLHIINTTSHEDTITNILETFMERKLKTSIYYTSLHVDDIALYNFIMSKKLLYQSLLNFVAVTKIFTCSCNPTEDQLQFIQSQKINIKDTTASDYIQMYGRAGELLVFQGKQLTALHYVGKTSQCVKNFTVFKRISTLKSFGIDKCIITSKVANDIVTILFHNKGLEQLYLNSKLQTKDLLNIMEVLEKFTSLKVFEISNNNITDQVTEYFTSIISQNVQLRCFSITNGNLCTTNAIKLSKALQSISNLQELTLTSNNINVEVATDIAAVVSHNSKIQKLNLDDNNLKTMGMMNIATSLQGISTLTSLHVSNNNVTKEASCHIAAALSCNTQLHELDISKNPVDIATIMNPLQNISTLKRLRISNNNITEQAADDIANVLASNIQLEVFDISGNCVKTPGVIKIAKSLQQITTLQQLYINNNNISDEAADDIVAVIYSNTRLKELNIGKNSLQLTGAIKIAKVLQYMFTLKVLCINNNNISDKAAGNIAAVIYNNTQLQDLNISENNLQSTGAIKIAKALQNISTLVKLRINDNHITDEAADDIAAALSHNTQLQELDVSNNWFQTKGIMAIAQALQNIVTLTKLYIGKYTISDAAANNIAIVLYNNTELQELDIGLNQGGVMCITTALCNNANLKVLKIKDNTLITEKAANSIAAAISANAELQVLEISGISFLTAPNTKILKALHCIFGLTKLYISNNKFSHEAADDIATAVSCNTQLQELDISNNVLEASGVIKISKALQGIFTLKKLCISSNNISDEAADDIVSGLSYNIQLQVLDISNNYFQEMGTMIIIKALQSIFTLTELYISNCNATDEAADDIAAVIYSNTQLQELDVSNNHLQSAGAIKIAKALQNVSTLTKLYINDNSITDEAADDIATAIYGSTQLQELEVSNNHLQSTGAIKIAKALQNVGTLTKLYVSNNNVTDEAADDIAITLSCNNRLQQLDISKNKFKALGIIIIAKALQNISTMQKLYISNDNITDEAADDLATAIYSNNQLQEFDVSHNIIYSTGAIKIAKALQSICTLTKLYINDNHITDEAADDIATVCSHNTQLQILHFSGNSFTGAYKLYIRCKRLLKFNIINIHY